MKKIFTEEEYDSAISRIEILMQIESPDQSQLDEMDELAPLIEEYEDAHYPIDPPSTPKKR
jgi:antitoxin component HigA of HigAB toxin-antitoxin module